MNKRRKLIFALGAGALAAPLCSFAQQKGKIWRVGFLTAYSSSAETPAFDSFRQAMRELGYDNGRNIAYETRWAEGDLERLPGMAEDLVKFKPDVMLVANTPSVMAAKKATTTIPIVMVGVGDPVGTGLVDNLARPGGNVTGFTNIIGEMSGKRLELLKEVVPRLSRVAALGQSSDPIFAVQLRHAVAVARSLKVEVFPAEIRSVRDIDGAFETLSRTDSRTLPRHHVEMMPRHSTRSSRPH